MQRKHLLFVISIHFNLLLQACAHNLLNNKKKKKRRGFFLADTKQYYFTFHNIREKKKELSFTSMVSLESDFSVYQCIQDVKFPYC
jgi:hypothetical protein